MQKHLKNIIGFATIVTSLSIAAHADGLTPDQRANIAVAQRVMGVWMSSKDLPSGREAQNAALRALSSSMTENVVMGVIPQGPNSDIPFAREFYGKEGVETFARLHWDTVHADYNAATGGNPVKFEFLGDNVIHAVNKADVAVRSNGCKVAILIDETWTFDNDHHVKAAKFSYDTSALNKAFRTPSGECRSATN